MIEIICEEFEILADMIINAVDYSYPPELFGLSKDIKNT